MSPVLVAAVANTSIAAGQTEGNGDERSKANLA